MNDLVDEVEEALRHDRAVQFFKRHGRMIGAGVLAIIVGTAGNSFYQYQQKQAHEAATARYIQALKSTDSLQALQELSKTSGAGTGLLAKFQYAAALAAKGQVGDARTVLQSIIADSALTSADQDFARVRMAMLELDDQKYDAALAAITSLKSTTNPMRYFAWEVEGLANWAKGEAKLARTSFELIANDAAAPNNFRQRAQAFMGMIDGGSTLKL